MSTYRRTQMERDLPEASPNLCEFLWKNFVEAGMTVPREDILFIGKLISGYVKQTPQGKHTMLTLMNCAPRPASALQTYFKAGYNGQEDKKLKPSDLMEFRGWIYKGVNAVKWDSIEIDEREDANVCDNCGGRYPIDYCMKQVETIKRTGESRIEQWCNNCRVHHDDPRVRQTGDQKVCGACEKITCEFHPKHHTLNSPAIALLPQRTAAGSDVPLPPGWARP